MTTFTLVVFGDVTNNISHTLRKLLLSAQSGPRNNFLRNTESALRQQFHRLYPHERDSLPNFAGIHDLLKIYEDGKGACHPAISNVLLCITQLLQLLRYYEGFEHLCGDNDNTLGTYSATGERARLGMIHRQKTLQALARYRPCPLSPTVESPRTFIIWATEGLRSPQHPEPNFSYSKDDPNSIERFMLEPRSNFGPFGWETLLPKSNIQTATTIGHHFNADEPPNVITLSKRAQDFLSTFHVCNEFKKNR